MFDYNYQLTNLANKVTRADRVLEIISGWKLTIELQRSSFIHGIVTITDDLLVLSDDGLGAESY